jgi:hypothetical protein
MPKDLKKYISKAAAGMLDVVTCFGHFLLIVCFRM